MPLLSFFEETYIFHFVSLFYFLCMFICESMYCQAALWYMLRGMLVAATGPLPLLLNK